MAIPREELHKLVDALTENATKAVRLFLVWIIEEDSDLGLAPLTEREWAGIRPTATL